MRGVLQLTSLAALALVAGCGGRKGEVVGTWQYADVQIELKADGTSEQNLFLPPPIGNVVMKGKWSLSGDTVTVTPQTVGGQPVAEFLQEVRALAKAHSQGRQLIEIFEGLTRTDAFTLSPDGRTMTFQRDEKGAKAILSKVTG